MRKILISLLFFTALMSSCRFMEGQRIRGNGHVLSEQRNVNGFSAIQNSGSMDVTVAQGDYKVVVEADENLIPYILTEREGDKLYIRFKNNIWVSHYTVAKVHVSVPKLNSLRVNGSGNIIGENQLKGDDNMQIQVAGSGDVKMNLDKPSVSTTIYGSGNIILAGQTGTLSSEINGSGSVRAFDLKAGSVKIEIRGSGGTQVTAVSSLDANILGSGDVKFKGAPQLSSRIRGSGSVSKAD